MGELYNRMLEDLKIGCYSHSTTKIYLLYARQLARFHMRSPTEMGCDEVRLRLAERPVSRRVMRQARAALTSLCTSTLRRPTEVESIQLRRPMKR